MSRNNTTASETAALHGCIRTMGGGVGEHHMESERKETQHISYTNPPEQQTDNQDTEDSGFMGTNNHTSNVASQRHAS